MAGTAKPRVLKVVNIEAGQTPRPCSGCGRPIYWCKNDKGQPVPVSVNKEMESRCSDPTDLLDGQGIIHFVDCPVRDQFKARKAKGE